MWNRHAVDGVVISTNLQDNVFVTYDGVKLNNSKNGILSKVEFHGAALSETNHISWIKVQRAPIQIDFSEIHVLQLPDLSFIHFNCTTIPDLYLETSTDKVHQVIERW